MPTIIQTTVLKIIQNYYYYYYLTIIDILKVILNTNYQYVNEINKG